MSKDEQEISSQPTSILDFLTPERTLFGIREDSKKRVFELISEITAKGSALDNKDVFEGLLSREKLGSTAIGHGVAIPHTRIGDLAEPIAALIQLQAPVDVDALDKQPVDIFFALLVPESAKEQHLQLLASVAKILHDPATRQRLRHAGSSSNLYQLIREVVE